MPDSDDKIVWDIYLNTEEIIHTDVIAETREFIKETIEWNIRWVKFGKQYKRRRLRIHVKKIF